MTEDRLIELMGLAETGTPGLWKSDGVRIGASRNVMLATICDVVTGREANANAHLMAAAPELLAEVVRLRARLEDG